jgi:peroxiredoxin
MAIEIGQEAPDFTLKDPAGDEVTLSSFRGSTNVVLVFYPGAFSDICTAQLSAIGAHEGRYADGDAQVIGVSVDSRHSQGAFARQLGLTDTILLADFHPKGEVSRRYGAYLDDFGFSARATFVIDRAGIVRGVSLTDNPGQTPDEEDYFAALAVCEA